jgi:glycosyltransferase involved in cell wall biosynthesis
MASKSSAPPGAAEAVPEAAARAFTGVRVVVVAHGPPMRGGIATVALDIVEDPLLAEEFEVVFLNTSQNDDQRGELALENVTRAVGHAWQTFRLARRGAVVHSHAVQHPVFVAWRQVAIALAARARGARVLLHNHAQPPYMEPPGGYRVSRAHRAAFAVLDRLVDANIMIAEAGVPNLRQYMPTTALPVVNNSIVVHDVTPTTADHDPPVVLFVGELLERKGVRDLLDALDLLEARGVTGWELRIVGDDRPGLDPLKDDMVRLIGERGRAGAMTGPLDRAGVYRHFAEADLYVFPTYTEGQPFTVIESLAAGVPIVGTDIQALANMISDGENGRLVPTGDVEALADAIEELLADPDRRRRISEANRDLARRRFDRAVFRDQLAGLYRLHGRPSRAALRRRARAGRR